MTSEFPVGLSRSDVRNILNLSKDVVAVEVLSEADALWRVDVAADGNPPVQMLIDNGINTIYLQILIPIEPEEVQIALDTLAAHATVGVTYLANSYYLRSAIFMNFSTALAITNTIRAMAFAYAVVGQALASRPVPADTDRASTPSHQPVVRPTAQILGLSKGGNVVLDEDGKHPSELTVLVDWTVVSTSGGLPELDASAIVIGPNSRVLSDEHFIFFNNKASPNDEVVLQGEPQATEAGSYLSSFSVKLDQLTPDTSSVVFVVSIYAASERGHSFANVSGGLISVRSRRTGEELAVFEMAGQGSTETAMIFGEIYRHRERWKFRAVGQGYSNGLSGIATDYGVNIG